MEHTGGLPVKNKLPDGLQLLHELYAPIHLQHHRPVRTAGLRARVVAEGVRNRQLEHSGCQVRVLQQLEEDVQMRSKITKSRLCDGS